MGREVLVFSLLQGNRRLQCGGRDQALREREGKEEGRLAEGRCQSNSGHRAFYSGHSESHQPELSGGRLSPF